ncbi:DUF1643 domain-containing protein [Bacillus subtilis]|uniref:DUF1643 domain-containing protein n=1 Tax=Bacillus subtilis group TaxID=653685 RepID=UPI000750E246|nr:MULTISPECIES: DUF1643 domain-containing protein [Bacillus subtilis group]AUS10703.1 DUF1643 domain-containing protein [Bacillus subtilis]KUP41776.1 hypothetical protein AU384_02235 [Bacillus halotolerans]MBA5715737.1 DUF1643 domain-containing protein [Bacillus subtilis]MEC4029682.1 DUF1643 domain-containing protein [Bacillus subtilis]WGD65738.1 DUF1643 domain-containing protein [Bacillus subtilis]
MIQKSSMETEAYFSKDREYRFLLKKEWSEKEIGLRKRKKQDENIVFLLLNPNKADTLTIDKTVMNATNYTVEEEYGSMTILNLFPYMSLKPTKLVENSKKYIDCNRLFIEEACSEADLIIIGWGHRGEYRREKREVQKILKKINKTDKLKCFKDDEKEPPLHLRNYNSKKWIAVEYKIDETE